MIRSLPPSTACRSAGPQEAQSTASSSTMRTTSSEIFRLRACLAPVDAEVFPGIEDLVARRVRLRRLALASPIAQAPFQCQWPSQAAPARVAQTPV
jgi:hypothetical protein